MAVREKITSYEEAVEYLYRIPRFTSKNTMEDTKKFLDRLGNPDRALRIIHVAGTNGKGSVCAYMRFILEAAGKRVAVFTSPHLTDIRERFVIGGKMPEKETFLRTFLEIYDMLDWKELEQGKGYHPTFFEYLFFMAMLLFSRDRTDYCILETGLGGRLDATNSVSAKELSVITRISLDHVEYLGDTVRSIAGEKAGIMMRGVPLVYLDAVPEASAVFEERASLLGIRAYPVSKKCCANLNFKNKTIDFSYKYRYDSNVKLSISTTAPYQVENAALAVKAVEVLTKEGEVTADQVREGLKECFWAGRMEEILPEVYVDGAHNEDGVRAFLEAVAVDGCRARKLLFGVSSDKDRAGMLDRIVGSGLFSEIAVARMRTKRTASMEDLEKLMQRYPKCAYTLYEDAGEALGKLLKGRKDERIYVAGSLYLVGEIKEWADHDQL